MFFANPLLCMPGAKRSLKAGPEKIERSSDAKTGVIGRIPGGPCTVARESGQCGKGKEEQQSGSCHLKVSILVSAVVSVLMHTEIRLP